MYVNYANCCRASAATAGCLQSRFGSVFGVLYRPHDCFLLGSIINLKPLQSMAFHTHVFQKCVYATSSVSREYGSCHLSVRHPQVRVFLASNHLEQILQVFGYLRYQISRPVGNRPVFYSLCAFCLGILQPSCFSVSPGIRPKLSNIRDTTNNIH